MTSDQLQDTETLSCGEVPALSRLYIASELGKPATRSLRAHLGKCPDCMLEYRESVRTAAALSRMTSEEREKRMIERRRNARHAQAFGHETVVKPKRRNFRLRMVLAPAILIYVIMSIANLGPSPGRVEIVEATSGVSIDQRAVDLVEGSGLVLPGRWVMTDRFAKAKIDARLCELQVGSSTNLLVESARPVRLRLRGGNVSVAGSTMLITVLGIVEVEEGRGRISLDDHGLDIEPESGKWTLKDMHGTRELELGRSQVFRMMP